MAAEKDMDELLVDEFESPSPKKDSPLKFPSPPKGRPSIVKESVKIPKRSIYPQHSQAIQQKKGEQLDKGQLDAIELYFDEARMLHGVQPEVAFGYLIKEVKPTKTINFAIMSAKIKIGNMRRKLLAKGTKKRNPRKPKRTRRTRRRKRPKTQKHKKHKNRKNKTRYKR